MAWTVLQLITEVQKRFPDANMTSLTTWTNLVHRDICSRIPEIMMDTVSQNLTSGTWEYDIAEVMFQVREVELVTGANVATKLEFTIVETLDQVQPGWRSSPPGVPTQYYLASNQASGNSEVIGFYPIPNTTTATYPYVLMQVSQIAGSDLTTGSLLPPTIPSAQVYIEGLSRWAAISTRPSERMTYNATYELEVLAVKDYIRTRSAESRPGNPNQNPRSVK